MQIQPGLAISTFSNVQQANGRHEEVATDFESVMMSILVSNMRKSSFGEGLFPGDKSDTLGGLFDMMVADQIADSGGIGVKQMVSDWLAKANAEDKKNAGS